MSENTSAAGRASEAFTPESGLSDLSDELPRLCSSLTEIGTKLDRLEDALHDLTQVLARAVGPPLDVTED